MPIASRYASLQQVCQSPAGMPISSTLVTPLIQQYEIVIGIAAPSSAKTIDGCA
jgi:hypothetical protein